MDGNPARWFSPGEHTLLLVRACWAPSAHGSGLTNTCNSSSGGHAHHPHFERRELYSHVPISSRIYT